MSGPLVTFASTQPATLRPNGLFTRRSAPDRLAGVDPMRFRRPNPRGAGRGRSPEPGPQLRHHPPSPFLSPPLQPTSPLPSTKPTATHRPNDTDGPGLVPMPYRYALRREVGSR